MIAPPKVIDDAKVILFSPIDSRHKPTGNCKHIVAGILQGPAAGLAICQYDEDPYYYLFYCDPDWNTITDTCHQTLQLAKDMAEFEYIGVSQTWQKHA